MSGAEPRITPPRETFLSRGGSFQRGGVERIGQDRGYPLVVDVKTGRLVNLL